MKLPKATLEKLADVIIRIGEAALIGCVAVLFLGGVSKPTALIGSLSGLVFISLGLYIHTLSQKKD
jgi:hypothetical protein